MSMTVPLSVVLESSRGVRAITREVRDLRFRWAVPGGFASCQVDLSRPLHLQPGELAQYGTLSVYDGRTGGEVWSGRVEDPGRSAGGDGPVWKVNAIGPSAHVDDRTVPLIYVDRRLDPWQKATGSSGERESATVTASDNASGGDPALILAFPPGVSIPTGAADTAVYYPLERAGQNLALLGYRWDAGITNGSWIVAGFSSGATQVRAQGATTSGGAFAVSVVGTNFLTPDRRPYLKFYWNSGPSSTGSSDDVWASFAEVVVRATTYGVDGTEKVTGYSSADATITASTVVADLLGRLLTKFDGPSASIATTTYGIDQLAYPDGVKPGKVFDDLMGFHPDHYWAAWERTPTGRHRFEWVKWPTEPRYDASVNDGFDSPGSAAELWNAVTVRGRDPLGSVRTVRRTSAVPALDAAGLVRETTIDLGDEVWSTSNANQVGDQFLAEHQYPPNAGRLVISRPVHDAVSGRMVQPWEIRPGLIRVRGVQPAGPDLYNPSGRDGSTVFRVVGCDYQASSNSATLELDSRPRTAAQMLADLARRPDVRRR